MPNVYFFLTCLFLYTSCQSVEADFGVATPYFPASSHLQKGLVNKYRTQFINAKSKEIAEDVSYLSYQLNNDNQLTIKNYNVAGELEVTNIYGFQEGAMLQEMQYIMDKGDTIIPTIHQATVKQWELDTANYHKTVSYDWGERIWTLHQNTNKDTTVLNLSLIHI